MAISAISSTGKIVPVSLFAHITETIAVCVRQLLAILREVEPALVVDVQSVDDVAVVAKLFLQVVAERQDRRDARRPS